MRSTEIEFVASYLRIDHLILNYSAQRPFATRTYFFRMHSQSIGGLA